MGELKDLFFGNSLFAPRQEVLRAVYIYNLDGETSRVQEIEKFSGWTFMMDRNEFGVAEPRLVCPDDWSETYGCAAFIRLIQDNGQYVLVRRAKAGERRAQIAVAVPKAQFDRLYYPLDEDADNSIMEIFDAQTVLDEAEAKLAQATAESNRVAGQIEMLRQREADLEQRHQKFGAEQRAWQEFKKGVEFGEWLKNNPEALKIFNVGDGNQPPVPMEPKGRSGPIKPLDLDEGIARGFPGAPADGDTHTTGAGMVWVYRARKRRWDPRLRQHSGCTCPKLDTKGRQIRRDAVKKDHKVDCPVWQGIDEAEVNLPF